MEIISFSEIDENAMTRESGSSKLKAQHYWERDLLKIINGNSNW